MRVPAVSLLRVRFANNAQTPKEPDIRSQVAAQNQQAATTLERLVPDSLDSEDDIQLPRPKR